MNTKNTNTLNFIKVNQKLLLLPLNSTSDGFSLIELVVVTLIISILAAIALPSFLAQTSKAKQAGAKTTISSINQAQTSYRTENTTFATTIDQLALGIQSNTHDYAYAIAGQQDQATVTATPTDAASKGYSGGNVRYFLTTNNQSAIASLICETLTPGLTTPAVPTINTSATDATDAVSCPSATEVKL